jgi:hypothetical protein
MMTRRSLADELAAHLDYLEARDFPFDEIARDALFAQLADERGITVAEVNRRVIEDLRIAIQKKLAR